MLPCASSWLSFFHVTDWTISRGSQKMFRSPISILFCLIDPTKILQAKIPYFFENTMFGHDLRANAGDMKAANAQPRVSWDDWIFMQDRFPCQLVNSGEFCPSEREAMKGVGDGCPPKICRMKLSQNGSYTLPGTLNS